MSNDDDASVGDYTAAAIAASVDFFDRLELLPTLGGGLQITLPLVTDHDYRVSYNVDPQGVMSQEVTDYRF